MSRSNPQQNTPHPCERWHEWNGERGIIYFYSKELESKVDVPLPFSFIVLDRLATVKGWHDRSKSGIYANEVRNTIREPFIVKAFKGGPLAQGFYREIKDVVGAAGGYYVANIYIAFRGEDQKLHIGSLQLKGSGLGAWMDFEKEHHDDIDEKAVKITGSVEDKKGKVVFKTPVFAISELSKESNDQAKALDVVLQKYLEAYLKRNTTEQASHAQPDAPDDHNQEPGLAPELEPEGPLDVPF